MDLNSWYYTLSAIPQTLATMIALAATFCVVKLDYISRKISDIRIDLRRFILLVTSKSKIEIHQIELLNDKEFLALYENGLDSLNSTEKFFGLEKELYDRYARELQRIIDFEWHSFFSADENRIIGYLTVKKDIFRSLLLQKRKILSVIYWSMSLVIFVIAISLLVLPSYNYFLRSSWLAYSIVIGAILSVIVTAKSVRVILNDK